MGRPSAMTSQRIDDLPDSGGVAGVQESLGWCVGNGMSKRFERAQDEEDVTLVRRWFERLANYVQAVDFVGARPLFAEDMVAFGTFANFLVGREATERGQWRNIWGTIDHFRCRLDDLLVMVSPDRLTAAGIVVFDSTGYRENGTPYDRPGRSTVVFGRRAVGADWVAQHTHFSLFHGVPPRSFGNKPEARAPSQSG
jgi:ketosteroid isomerase-like protein